MRETSPFPPPLRVVPALTREGTRAGRARHCQPSSPTRFPEDKCGPLSLLSCNCREKALPAL